MSQNALPITVTTGAPMIFNALAQRMCRGNRVRVQLKTVLRISHHWGFAGISTTTVPSLSPVASCSAKCRSPCASTLRSTPRLSQRRPLTKLFVPMQRRKPLTLGSDHETLLERQDCQSSPTRQLTVFPLGKSRMRLVRKKET